MRRDRRDGSKAIVLTVPMRCHGLTEGQCMALVRKVMAGSVRLAYQELIASAWPGSSAFAVRSETFPCMPSYRLAYARPGRGARPCPGVRPVMPILC